ncbi:LuxR family transcriptional regulator [Streptomyces botrytidirepellens]|uniref:LuxR family transcriptional regulator n=1 Tax=Streptomyces botrytidirepellens TaxID=2486417 RepID=A0A3M8WRX4_9ACTN|nr:LuxR family transcriptional regulator [Streptomyces botrytidirepellens]
MLTEQDGTVLFERTRELAVIRRCLDGARDGRGELVTVSGPFGSGRSALLGELARRTSPSEALVLRAEGARSEGDVPFGVARRALHGLHPGAAPPAGATEESEALRLRDVLLGLADAMPVLLLIDDLRWVDADSLRWLSLIGEKLADAPVVIVAVAPHSADSAAHSPLLKEFLAAATERVALRPLSPDGMSAMAGEFLGEPESALIRACAEVSGGRPLFLAALLQELRRTQWPPRPDDVRALRPAAIGTQAVRALAELPRAEREIATALAVVGPRTDSGLLFTMAELTAEDGTAALGALKSVGLLDSGPVPRFAHDAIGEAVAHSLDTAAMPWHARAAQTLHAAGRPPEEVAGHVLAAGDPPGGWQIEVLREAARTALANKNPDLARKYLLRALLGSPHRSGGRAELLVDLAGAELASDPVSSLRRLMQALPGLATPARRARELVRIPVLACELPPSGLTTQLADAAAGLGDPALLEGSARETALALDARLRVTHLRHVRWFTETVRAFRLEGTPGDVGSAPARDRAAVLSYAGMLAGKDSGAVAALARHVVLAEPPTAEDLRTAVPLAVRAMLAADLFDQVDIWLASMAMATLRANGGGKPDTLIADAERAFALARRGRHTDAALMAARTLERADAEFAPVTGRCCEALALVIAGGDPPAAAGDALARYRAQDNALLAPWLGHVVDGMLALLAGDTAVALDHILEAGREHELMGWANPAVLPWRSWAAQLQYRLGRQDLAHDLIAREYEQAVVWGAPSVVGRTLRVWTDVTKGEKGIELALRAVDGLDVSTDRVAMVKAHLLLGVQLFAPSHATTAEHLPRNEQLPQSTETERAGDRPDSRRTVAVDAALTPSERRVALLVAAGKSNQNIATELRISLRAVEKHLTKVYRKLGVAGRTQLMEIVPPIGRGNGNGMAV